MKQEIHKAKSDQDIKKKQKGMQSIVFNTKDHIAEITFEEVEQTVKKGKSSGPESIPAELIKYIKPAKLYTCGRFL